MYGLCRDCKYDKLKDLLEQVIRDCCYSDGLKIMDEVDEILIERGIKSYETIRRHDYR